MLVLLCAAVLPMLAVRAVQAVSIYRLQERVANQMRDQLNEQAQEDMQRTVKGYARSLDQLGRLGQALLRVQASEIEARLIAPPPRQAIPIPSVSDFARFEQAGQGPFRIEPSTRHAVVDANMKRSPLNISYDTQVVLPLIDPLDDEAVQAKSKLVSMTGVYREIHEQLGEAILWQYTTLESGLHFSYPGKSAFPPGYDPRQQQWFGRAEKNRRAVTSQPYFDNATRQLVITLAQPITGRGRAFAGVTALDLRVSSLLDPQALNTPWANDASVMVVATYPAKDRIQHEQRNRPGSANWRADRFRSNNNDIAGEESDTSYPPDVYVVADNSKNPDTNNQPSALATVAFDSASDRQAVLEDLLQARPGVRRVFIDGQDRTIAYGQVGSTEEGRPAFAMIVVPTRTIHQPAEIAVQQISEDLTASLVTTGGILVGLMILVFVSAFFMSFRITRPITELAKASKRVASGDLDATVTVNRKDELGQLGQAFNQMVPALRDRMKMRESLHVAMQVQQSLLPDQPPRLKGLDLAGHSEYCDETGGDYYDFIQLDQVGPNAIAIAVGDVTGHGIAAALLMATGRALIRSHANTNNPLGHVFTQVNQQLCDSEFTGRFMTLMYLLVENPHHNHGPIRVRFLSAGHDPVIVYRPAEDAFFQLEGHDIPLGIDPTWQYNEQTSDSLRTGDILVIGTDGIWECFNPKGQQFGKERLKQTIRNASHHNAKDIAKAVSNACKNWRDTREQGDDITMVVIKLT